MKQRPLKAAIPLTIAVLIAALNASTGYSWSRKPQGQKIFEKRCIACHTIGGGKRIGPDLSSTGARPEKALRDDIARMQTLAGSLKKDEIDHLVNFLQERAKAKAPAAETIGRPVPASWPGDWASSGARLYSGRQTFKNGGMACISCHGIRRHGLVSPLGRIAHRNEAADLLKFISGTHIPSMRRAYAGHAVTEEEAKALASYFKSVGEQEKKKP